MKFRRMLITLLASLSVFLFASSKDQVAGARQYTTIPKSLRGHWYYYSDTAYFHFQRIVATKYTWNSKDWNIDRWVRTSGKKFPKYAHGHSDLLVTRTPKGYYKINRYNMRDDILFKRVVHEGHSSLLELYPKRYLNSKATGYYYGYYYKTKKTAYGIWNKGWLKKVAAEEATEQSH